jgi:hypothetical protein
MPVRSSRAQPLRYYLYVSDAKLDMLFEQIDRSLLKRISAEIKVDLKLASITLKGADNPGPTRMAKLRIVDNYIDAHHNVGDIASPGTEYFRGKMAMQWGWLTHKNSQGEKRLPIVFFRGWDGSHLVMLAGSRRHVLGNPEDSEAYASMSELPSIVAAIGESISEDPQIAMVIRTFPNGTANLSRSEIIAGLNSVKGFPKPLSGIVPPHLIAMYSGSKYPETPIRNGAFVRLDSPAQHVEFLAVPLIETDTELAKGEYVHGILGTPLYVALAR